MTTTKANAEPTLPPTITVGPLTYTVALDATAIHVASIGNGSPLMGSCDYAKQSIALDPTLAADALATTLLHEVLHAVTEMTGYRDTLGPDKDEELVNRLAPPLLDVLRRNPSLVAFLVAEGAGGAG